MTLCTRCLRPIRLHVVCTVCQPDAPLEAPPDGEPWVYTHVAFPADLVAWVREHVASKDVDHLTEEECVAVRVVLRGWVRDAGIGYVMGIMADLRAKADQQAEAAAFAKANAEKALTGAYIGKVGERGVFRLTCDDVKPMGDGEYGPRFLLIFSGPLGERVIWWTGSGKFDPQPGMVYDVTATVKAHEPYNGVRQTTITRPKV